MFTACHISFVCRQLLADYRDWKGEGVWGVTFRGFSKNDYNPNEMAIWIDEEQVTKESILSIIISSDFSHYNPSFLPACGRHLADHKVFTFPRNERKISFQLSWFASGAPFPRLCLCLPWPRLLLSQMLVNKENCDYCISVIFCHFSPLFAATKALEMSERLNTKIDVKQMAQKALLDLGERFPRMPGRLPAIPPRS